MRICRVAISYPTTKSPGAGLVAYYLCKHIKVPTLYLTIKQAGVMVSPTSAYLDIEAIDLPLAQSSSSLNRKLHAQRLSLPQRVLVYTRIALSGRSVKFLVRSVPRMIRFRPDIVCCHSNLTLYHGLFFNLLLRKKFVLHVHAISDAIAICNLPVLRWMVNRVARIYCISEIVRDKLSDVICFDKLQLTSTGVDPEVFFDTRSLRKKQIIQVGQLMWYKGHRYLLEAMPTILSKHPDCKLLIVGKGQFEHEIVEYIASLGLGNSVKMIPTLSHEKLRYLYNKSSLLVMPSLYEGLPKVLLEAFACGLPAVITDACNAMDISVGRAIVVPKESPGALAKAVCSMLGDRLRWEAYSRNCVSIVETHNWRIISKRIFQDYQRVLDSGH